MTLWEYTYAVLAEIEYDDCHRRTGVSSCVVEANDLGLDGWELVSVLLIEGIPTGYFKRPIN